MKEFQKANLIVPFFI
uniref:Uncharacterized protein n=1 Tax=Arundo donax TaxID=35708 RepID=A0A0A9BNF0_ARUDO